MDSPLAVTAISAREAEVLAAVAEHLSNVEIAARLFISVRTVESHVSSLLRKTGVSDRRALIGLAPAGERSLEAARWPTALTSFIGRTDERSELAQALASHRLVTAVGPGGVGKTRLAQVVAADAGAARSDGARYVDLVPVTDPAMVTAAVADALGVGEQRGRTTQESVLDALRDLDLLLVLDNCEHVADGVVLLLERLLVSAPRLTVLATSRARLLVPYETVFEVPGLSPGDDAIDLFLARARAAGAEVEDADRNRVAAICAGLDGMALAIELAAARVPVMGLDGLEAGLSDRLDLLAGGRRIDDRHRSLRAALDWSWRLLDADAQSVLRWVSVFATPFTVADAAQLVDAPASDLAARLAELTGASLLVATTTADGTRFRALETIRQFASERLLAHGEADEAHTRHARWGLSWGRTLVARTASGRDWRAEYEWVIDELRSALVRAEHLAPGLAYDVAICVSELDFARGMPRAAQRSYERAATLAGSAAEQVAALRWAAGAAETRHFGDEALRLHYAAAEAARASDPAAYAGELARVVELVCRASGLISRPPSRDECRLLLEQAATAGGDNPLVRAQVQTARAYMYDELDPLARGATLEAIELARAADVPLIECGALDGLMVIEVAGGDLAAAVRSTQRRVELLTTLPVRAESGLEFSDGFNMAADIAVGAGDLAAARRFATVVHDLPFHHEEDHLATARLLLVTALAGDWDETLAFADRYRAGWERAGRPRDGDLNRGVYAVATVLALRGDDDGRATWLELVDDMLIAELVSRDEHFYQFLDALLLLHTGSFDAGVERFGVVSDAIQNWREGLWRSWRRALAAEAAVLAGRADAEVQIARAAPAVAGNPLATAILDRARALLDHDREAMLAAATVFARGGCRYQQARTLVLAGGAEAIDGRRLMAAMGARPMAEA